MRSCLTISALAILAAAAPAPVPQDIDIDMVIAAPDPSYTQAIGVTAQSVTYDITSLVAQATEAASSISIDISDVAESTAIARRDAGVGKRSACAPQPTGVSSYAVIPDTASAFVSYDSFAAAATSAPNPSGYSNTFTNLDASSNAYGYLGFTTLDSYDTETCANKCNAINGCMSFNIYFERDPSVDPGTGCEDPPSVTMIKCVFWGGPLEDSTANNFGQYRSNFQVVNAGSNGYTNNSIIVPSGFTNATDLGSAAINAPFDAQGYNTFMGSTIFNSGPFNASLCADYCAAQTQYNLAHPASNGSPPKVCHFFNTYILYVNDTTHLQGQYCSLYTEAWDASFATNDGQWRGDDHYQIMYSYSYTNKTSAGPDPTNGDVNGAVHQASVDISYSTLQPFCSTTTVATQDTVTAVAKRDVSTPNVLTKYPATVISSACSLQATAPS